MGKYTFTEQARVLYEALIKIGVEASKEYWDGHKHLDIAIVPARLFVEIDGLPHYTDPDKIEADFKRDHFSDGDDFDTIRIPNIIVETHLEEVVNAIAVVVAKRIQK